VSLEIRESDITDIAQVVLPVAAVVEKSGSFADWQGKNREFDAAVESLNRSDVRILSMLADEMGRSINLPSVSAARKEIASLGNWDGAKPEMKRSAAGNEIKVGADEAVITSWRNLLDKGSLQEGEDNLAGTARATTAVISQNRATALSVKSGELIRVSNTYGAITLPCTIADIDDAAIWLPRNSANAQLIKVLGTVGNSAVKVSKA
jgi:NADH-quinone oxidoreductase subunit G